MKRGLPSFSAPCAALCIILLSGCSAPLNTEETCDYIGSRFAAPELEQELADRDDFRKISETASGILDDAAQRTGDAKLREALTLLSNSTKETLLQYEENAAATTQSPSTNETLNAGEYEVISYFMTTCPGTSPFS